MEENKQEIQFLKLGLSENDILVLRVDINGLNEEQAVKKLADIREDDFVKYVESRGNKVITTYTGLDINILRLNDGDKVLAYANVTSMDEEQEEKYLDYIKYRLQDTIGDRLICVPVRNGSPVIKIKEGD